MKVLDGMGMEYEVEVMVAMHQGYTTEPDPLDPLSGTIESNPRYEEWLKSREARKAEPVTVEAMQNLPKESRTSVLVEELRKRMEGGSGKGVVGSDMSSSKSKKNKKSKKKKGKDVVPPPSLTEQPKMETAAERKPPVVFKIISRHSPVDSKPKDAAQSTTAAPSVSEPFPQERTTPDHPVSQGKVRIFRTTSHASQAAPKKYTTSEHQHITTTTDDSKDKNEGSLSPTPDGHAQLPETRTNSSNETSDKHVATEEMTDAATRTAHTESILNPPSTPFLPVPATQMESAKTDKSGSKKFTTLSSKSPPLSPVSPPLTSMTEGLSRVQIGDRNHDGKSGNVVTSISQPEIPQSSHSLPNDLDNVIDDHTIKVARKELSQEQTATTFIPQPSEATEHGNRESNSTNKAIDKPKKKFASQAGRVGVPSSNEKDSRAASTTSKSPTHKDKQHSTRYFDSHTNTPSAGSKRKGKGGSSSGSGKDTSHASKDKTPSWFIDIPAVKEQSGGVNIASFNLPSLQQSHQKCTASGEVQGEYHEVVVTVPIRSEFIPTTQYGPESEITSPLPNASEMQNAAGKATAKKKKKRGKKGKAARGDSTTALNSSDGKARLEELEWQRKYDVLMATRPQKSGAPPQS